jgi:uncharacterized protein
MGQPVVWFEVLGNDRDALVRFYGDLFDWRAAPVEGWPYSMIDTGADGGIGGGIGQPPDGAPGHVTFYVKVDDVGSTLERIKELGGSPLMGPDAHARRKHDRTFHRPRRPRDRCPPAAEVRLPRRIAAH